MKGKITAILLLLAILLTFGSCKGAEVAEEETTAAKETTAAPEETAAPEKTETETNHDLHELLIDHELWRSGEIGELYRYADDTLSSLLTREAFTRIFTDIIKIGGLGNGCVDIDCQQENGYDIYSEVHIFENIRVKLQVTMKDLQICGITHDIRFNDTFEIENGDGTVSRYFLLKNDGYELNAVYPYKHDGEIHPAALLIPGSGPSDYNETVGMLAPLADIANALAARGISSLRFEKRTNRYPDSIGATAGMEEEYLSDCRAALTWLHDQPQTGDVYLLGHSLGGQIATVLATESEVNVTENTRVSGMILWNSTPRHLADVLQDQLTAADPENAEAYRQYTAAAKAAKESAANGSDYYGVSDHYWASYNSLDTIRNISGVSTIPTLIVNSTADAQIFEADLAAWSNAFANSRSVTLKTYDDMSHFGYKIDTADPASLYSDPPFPEELIADFSDLCK